MWNRAELKAIAKSNFKRVYKQAVIVCIIVYIIGAIFNEGYNSANNTIQYKQTYYENNGELYNSNEYANENEEFNLGNEIVKNEDTIINVTSNGIISTFFLSIFNAINSKISGIAVASLGLIMLCIMLIASVLRMIILNPIVIGKNNFFMGIREGERKVGDIFFLFDKSKFIKPVITMFFVELYTLLWTFLLIIPGIVKSYEYRMIPYILSENPDIDRSRAFELSKYMMNGQKWETFVLDLSFIGWHILSSITIGLVGVFYVNPYVESTYAELYAVLRENAIQRNFTNNNELPGFNLIN